MEMAAYAIWFLAAELAMLAAPAVAVALSRGALGRKAYTNRFAVAFVLWIVATSLAGLSVAAVLPLLAIYVLTVRWTAMRLNDLQSTRWYALLWYFGPVGLVLSIVLTEKRHRNDPVLF